MDSKEYIHPWDRKLSPSKQAIFDDYINSITTSVPVTNTTTTIGHTPLTG